MGPKPGRAARRSVLGRADLLYCLDSVRKDHLERVAGLLGYRLRKEEAPTAGEPGGAEAPFSTAAQPEPRSAPKPSPARFIRVVGYQPVEAEERVTQMPPDLADVSPLPAEEPVGKAAAPPAAPPLAPWSRLWPFLRTALGDRSYSRRLDLPRIVRLLAEGRALRRLPRLPRAGWAPHAQLLLDTSAHLFPFQDDFHALCERLVRLRGASGLDIRVFEEGPSAPCRPWRGRWPQRYAPYRPPPPGTPVLILGDLGSLEGGGHAWLQLGAQLHRVGRRPVALMPSPSRCWSSELRTRFRALVWDRGQRLSLRSLAAFSEVTEHASGGDSGVTRLLRLLSLSVRAEPALVRAVRYLLPAGEVDVGSEAAVWDHPDVCTAPSALALRSTAIEHYRSEALKREPRELLERAGELIRNYHAHLPQIVQAEEAMIQAQMLSRPPEPEAVEFMQRMLTTVLDRPTGFPHQAGLEAWVLRMAARQHPALWRWDHGVPLAAAVASVLGRERDADDIALPAGFDLNRVLWALEGVGEPMEYQLRQRRTDWVAGMTEIECLPAVQTGTGSDGGMDSGGLRLANLRMQAPRLPWEHLKADGSRDKGFARALSGGSRFEVPSAGRLRLWGNFETLEIDQLQRPAWADTIGTDAYGLYADFSYRGIVQRFRWIPPGRFRMGSPEGEPERDSDETLHEVILTRGYWLADTACTQQLWSAVLGKNPSRFKDDGHPVEQVSWEDVGRFLDRLNRDVPGLDLRLPTEAEWEYACRAGTETPFWFGENITPERVNYEGNYPYAGGKKGLYREKTVEVKALPCNSWGLYQMHGNVWEWCQDWFGEYPAGPVTDPMGLETGDRRVLRGGSWFYYAGFCRSAYRNHWVPGDRRGFAGFRFARGRTGGKSGESSK